MKKLTGIIVFSTFLIMLLTSTITAGIFDKYEYAARRAKFMQKIPDGIAIIMGAQMRVYYNEYYMPLRNMSVRHVHRYGLVYNQQALYAVAAEGSVKVRRWRSPRATAPHGVICPAFV